MIWGEHAEKHPELLKEEAKCSLFTLGNHTYHHKDLTKLSIKEGKNEIAKNDEVIEKITGQQPELIRPPFGSVNADVLSYLNRLTIIWSLDTKSWDHHDKDKVLENIRQIHNGDIVLMHDFQPADSDAIEPLIKFLLKDGFTPVSLKELVGKDNFYNQQIIYSQDRFIIDDKEA